MTATPAPPTATSPIASTDRSARAAVVDVDWKKAAQAAMGSALVAGLITGALYVLGKVVSPDEDSAAANEAPERAPSGPYAPFVYVTDDGAEDIEPDGDEHCDGQEKGEDDTAAASNDADEPAAASADDMRPPIFVDSEIAEAAATLGVPTNATESEIKSAYRHRVRLLHPDHNTYKGEVHRLTEETKRLNHARDVMRKHTSRVRP